MADEHQVPPPAERSGERIQERDHHEAFARLPEHETHPRTEPGAGPHGSTATSGTNLPIVVMAIGGLIALSVFVLQSPWILALGVVIFVAGAIWAGIAGAGPGTMGGSGPSTIDPDERR